MTTKKRTKLSTLFLLLISLTIFSCSDGDGPTMSVKNELVGTWLSEKVKVTVYINDEFDYETDTESDRLILRFEEDKTGEITNEDTQRFTYRRTGTLLTLTITGSNGGVTEELLTISELTETKLILRYELIDEFEGDVRKEVQLVTLNKQ